MSIFKGAGVAIVTPFKRTDLSVDYDALANMIDFQIEGGTDCIVICGSTGEAATMTEEEHIRVCKFAIDYTKKRVPVVAGSGSNCTKVCCELSAELAAYGADGLLIMSPYYNKGTQEGMFLHFKAAAEAAKGTPIIMYNVPSRTGGNILPDTAAKAFHEIPNVVAMKEASGNISQIVELSARTDGKLDIYSGNDDQVVPIMSMGGLGVISVVSNVAPKFMHDMCMHALNNEYPQAAAMQRQCHDLCRALFSEVNPIPVKKALNFMGMNAGSLRMPLTEMTEKNAQKMRQVMIDFGIRVTE